MAERGDLARTSTSAKAKFYRHKWLLGMTWLAVTGIASAEGQNVTGGAGFDIISYTVALRPDLETGAVSGIETIDFRSQAELTELHFSSNALVVKQAAIDGVPANFITTSEGISFALPPGARAGQRSTLNIHFGGTPRRGLIAKSGTIYASYFACDWMFCLQDTPGDKALFALDLYLPAGARSIGIGRQLSSIPGRDGLTVQRWRARRPYSPYLFGFAAGALRIVNRREAGSRFTFADATGGTTALVQLFDNTAAIASFLSGKAGLPLPGRAYTQILVAGREAQEAAGFSLIGKTILEQDRSDPQSQWILVHEMAHQWWGNLITCATWRDFWLNEGFATFMTAAWKQHRFGDTAYKAELDVARARVERAAAEGFDKPLRWNGKYPSLSTRRAVQYSKGALFLDKLRTEIGDDAFWRGIRAYTQRSAGRTVTSQDFERIMADVSGRDLSSLFKQWVYGSDDPVAAS